MARVGSENEQLNYFMRYRLFSILPGFLSHVNPGGQRFLAASPSSHSV